MTTLRLRNPVVALALALLCSPLAVAPAAASGLAGAWKGTMDTQMGPVETTIRVEATGTTGNKMTLVARRQK